MTVKQAIKILTDGLWFYEGSTKIDGVRCYIMRKYCPNEFARQQVVYFTTYGLRLEATKEKLRNEAHFS